MSRNTERRKKRASERDEKPRKEVNNIS